MVRVVVVTVVMWSRLCRVLLIVFWFVLGVRL